MVAPVWSRSCPPAVAVLLAMMQFATSAVPPAKRAPPPDPALAKSAVKVQESRVATAEEPLLIRPPPVCALLRAKVQFVALTVPLMLYTPPPVPELALFDRVLFVSVRVPELKMPPPFVAPLSRFPSTAQFCRVRLPLFMMPAPFEKLPFAIARPEMPTPGAVTLKMRPLFSPLIINARGPGPLIVIGRCRFIPAA